MKKHVEGKLCTGKHELCIYRKHSLSDTKTFKKHLQEVLFLRAKTQIQNSELKQTPAIYFRWYSETNGDHDPYSFMV